MRDYQAELAREAAARAAGLQQQLDVAEEQRREDAAKYRALVSELEQRQHTLDAHAVQTAEAERARLGAAEREASLRAQLDVGGPRGTHTRVSERATGAPRSAPLLLSSGGAGAWGVGRG
eukprot:SAG25_NODE_872_length_4992_cov_3.716183_9_plen_119_part_01